VHSDQPGMAAHLEKCPFFERYVPPEKFCYQEVEEHFSDGEADFDECDGSDSLDINRHWQELREIAGMYW